MSLNSLIFMKVICKAVHQCMKSTKKLSEPKTHLYFHSFYFHSFNHEINPDRGTLTRWEQTLEP